MEGRVDLAIENFTDGYMMHNLSAEEKLLKIREDVMKLTRQVDDFEAAFRVRRLGWVLVEST